MRRRPELFFVAVSVICIFGGSFASESVFDTSSVKASTYTEDFGLTACCFAPPATEELICGAILLFTPIFTLGLIVDRWSTYHRAGRQLKEFNANQQAVARDFLMQDASEKELGKWKNPLSEVVTQALGEDYANKSRPRIQIEQARQRAVARKQIAFEERLWIIAAVAITMPLFCLFISLIGLTNFFLDMRYEETISTWPLVYRLGIVGEIMMWGIGVSIPVFWIHRRLVSKAKSLTAELDDASAKLLDLVLNFQSSPWLLEPKPSSDIRVTKSFSGPTSGLRLNRQI